MSMEQSVLVSDLKASLNDAASVFAAADDADFKRFLDVAAFDLSRFRRRTLKASIQLISGQSEYDAPNNMMMPKMSDWGVSQLSQYKPWQASYPGKLPRLSAAGDPDARTIILSPAPTQAQINNIGSVFSFYYYASHTIGDGVASQTTVKPEDKGLLLLRAQAEAMKELSMRNIKKPAQLRDGLNSAPKNGTPAALFEQLMASFREQAQC